MSPAQPSPDPDSIRGLESQTHVQEDGSETHGRGTGPPLSVGGSGRPQAEAVSQVLTVPSQSFSYRHSRRWAASSNFLFVFCREKKMNSDPPLRLTLHRTVNTHEIQQLGRPAQCHFLYFTDEAEAQRRQETCSADTTSGEWQSSLPTPPMS